MIRAALIQLKLGDGSKEERLARALELIDRAGDAGLILLPELWNVGYLRFERYRDEAEPLEGPTISTLAAKARELGAYILAGSIVEREDERLYNASALISPRGEPVAAYRKIHLFGYRSKEKELLTPGDRIVVAETELGALGLSICYDLRFPELYRAQVDRGAQAFLVVASWPLARIGHWRLLARVRALENQCFLLGCNATGPGYGGHSLAVSPQGEVLKETADPEEVLEIELDLEEVRRARAEFPVIRDRVLH
ncbi:MAG: carbon-nitrogen family hydrolase [Candidatus Bipolaricaulia bacterium]